MKVWTLLYNNRTAENSCARVEGVFPSFEEALAMKRDKEAEFPDRSDNFQDVYKIDVFEIPSGFNSLLDLKREGYFGRKPIVSLGGENYALIRFCRERQLWQCYKVGMLGNDRVGYDWHCSDDLLYYINDGGNIVAVED